jgi:Glycosyl-transferase for dystroglycan
MSDLEEDPTAHHRHRHHPEQQQQQQQQQPYETDLSKDDKKKNNNTINKVGLRRFFGWPLSSLSLSFWNSPFGRTTPSILEEEEDDDDDDDEANEIIVVNKKRNYSSSSTVPVGSNNNCHNPHYTIGTLHQRNVAAVAAAVVGDHHLLSQHHHHQQHQQQHHVRDYADTYHDTTTTAGGGVWKQQQQQQQQGKPYHHHHKFTHQRRWLSFSSFLTSLQNCCFYSLVWGKQYYPGKDKRRREMMIIQQQQQQQQQQQRKTYWYVMFCSTSPFRQKMIFSIGMLLMMLMLMMLVVVVVSYCWFTLTSNTIGQYNNRIRSSTSTTTTTANSILKRLQYDTSLQFLSIRQEQIALHHIESERSRLQSESSSSSNWHYYNTLHQHQHHRNEEVKEDEVEAYDNNVPRNARQQLLEHLAPNWYHRYDDPKISNILHQHRRHDQRRHDKKHIEVKKGEETRTGVVATSSNNNNNNNNNLKKKQNKRQNQSNTAATHLHDNNNNSNNSTSTSRVVVVSSQQTSTPNTTLSTTVTTSTQPKRLLTVIGGKNSSLPFRTIHNHNNNNWQSSSSCHVQPKFRIETTLVIQTTESRLWIMGETCQRWKQPIVVTIFVPYRRRDEISDANYQKQHQQPFMTNDDDDDDDDHSLLLNKCPQLQLIRYLADKEESQEGNYPINRLRNVGLDHVKTSHILVVDIDFVPSQGLDQVIHQVLISNFNNNKHQESKDQKSNRYHALVIPAFERLPPKDCVTELDCAQYLQTNAKFLPQTFEELSTCVSSGKCIVFQSLVNVDGHSTTNSHDWLNRKWYDNDNDNDVNNNDLAITSSPFRSIPCFHTSRYEPYVVLEWCRPPHNDDDDVLDSNTTITTRNDDKKKKKNVNNDNENNDMNRDGQFFLPMAPYYDERFHGYGKNKIELISHLRKSGYRFDILPKGFLVHNPHPESSVKQRWNDQDQWNLHHSMDALYGKFLNELDIVYADQHNDTIPLCRRRHG